MIEEGQKKQNRYIIQSTNKARRSVQAILRANAVGAAEYILCEEKLLTKFKGN